MTEPTVVPVHTAVRGRARFRVAGLRRNERLKQALEDRLAGRGIHSISASTRTGTVLVLFEPRRELEEVVRRLRDARQIFNSGGARDLSPGEAWHAMDADRVLAAVGSHPSGLALAEARQRLGEHGPNVIPKPPRRSDFAILLAQFHSLPIALLAVGAVLSVATGGLLDAAIIFGVICLNGAIGYLAEARAEATISMLGESREAACKVLRDNEICEVPAEDLVPGDVVQLSRDDTVPADARIIEADGLTVNEATLTGESAPVEKAPEFVAPPSAPIADRRGMVFNGTIVTGGAGRAVIVASGPRSELGRIQSLLGATERPATPLERQLNGLGRQMVFGSVAACGLFLVIGLLRGFRWLPLLKTVVSLGVAATPEGLPTLATTTLALAIRELRQRRVIIRRLGAMEALAAVKVVCFDKTGTLTINDMNVVRLCCGARRACLVGQGFKTEAGADLDWRAETELSRLLELSILCNDAELQDASGARIDGSATEAALVRAALRAGIDVNGVRSRHPRLADIQRAEDRRYMATAHRTDAGQGLVVVKGDPREVLELCREHLCNGAVAALKAADRNRIISENSRMADEALRVLGVAFRSNDADNSGLSLEKDFVWVGLVGMADPIRPEAPGLIDVFRDAGITSVMLTGDQRSTAAAVAAEMGLSEGGEGEIVDAQRLDEYARRIPPARDLARVFARVAPGQKLQLVRALQDSGQMVAMVGDGVNDTPPLRSADVGIALGQSGAVATRGIADVVLLNDDLASLAGAVERSRAVALNIRKAIRFMVATNLSEIIVMLASAAAGGTQPLSPLQLLWINLLTDVLPALGLAMEKPAADLMRRRPSDADEPLISSEEFGWLLCDSGLMSVSAFLSRALMDRVDGATGRGRTLGFATLVTAQLLYAFACRRRRSMASGGSPPPNPLFVGTLGISFAAQAAALLLPGLRRLFGPPLGLGGFAMSLGAGAAPLVAIDILKEIRSRST